MRSRIKNVVISPVLCKALASFLSSSFFPTRNFTISNYSSAAPRTKTRKPTSLSAPNQVISSSVICSDVAESVYSLLSNQLRDPTDLCKLLKGYENNLNSDIVLQILMNYKQLGRKKTLEFFSWAALVMDFSFDDSVTEYMADFFGRRKLFDDMKCLLVTVSSRKGQVSCRTFSICIRFLGRQGRIREALCLFEDMASKFKCQPDILVYNNILYVLCKKETSGELIEIAMSIFRRIELPDKYSYSNILVGLCKFGSLDMALEVFGEMVKAGLVPTRSAVNNLIGELCSLSAKEGAIGKVKVRDAKRPFTILVPNLVAKRGAIEPAIGVFWAVNEFGLVPSTFIVNQLIFELCRLSKMQEAIKVLKIAEERKLSCVGEAYSVVMQALCEHGEVNMASLLFQGMFSLGMKPKLAIYNAIICMLCKLGSLDNAEKVFKIMSKRRCLPDHTTYSALIHAYAEAKNWKVSNELLKEMLSLGWSPHYHTYYLVVNLLKEHDKTDLCFELEIKLEAQILQKFCEIGRLEDAREKLKSMLEKGVYPPIYVRNAFENSFRKYGKLEEVSELLAQLDEAAKKKKQKILIIHQALNENSCPKEWSNWKIIQNPIEEPVVYKKVLVHNVL